MIQHLPYGGFEWLSEEETDKFDLIKFSENSSIGCILEIDPEYPNELHDMHNDYPLAPEKLEISQDMSSNYCSNIADEYGIKIGGVKKLVPNLRNKEVCCSLQKSSVVFVIRNKFIKVHRILKLKQSNWLKKHNNFNTDKRENGTNSFESNFFKLANNSIFRKTIKNLRKRINVELINRCVSEPNFTSQKIFSKNFVAVHKIKPVLTLNKPIYMGFSILDLSKLLMYKFHYGYIKNKFDAKLLFTDTDSLVYEIKTEDAYEDSYSNKDLFDFSDYTLNSKFFDPTNEKIIGKMKDEFKGEIISEFVGLKSKMYSLITVKNEEVIKAKRVNKKIRHEEFVDVLSN